MRKELGLVLLVGTVAVVMAAPVLGNKKSAKKESSGAELFAHYCASCHAGGGNLVKPKHPIIGSEQLNNILVFKAYLSAPPGHMPYYQHIVKDKKKLESLYNFCKTTYKERVQTQSRASQRDADSPIDNTANSTNHVQD